MKLWTWLNNHQVSVSFKKEYISLLRAMGPVSGNREEKNLILSAGNVTAYRWNPDPSHILINLCCCLSSFLLFFLNIFFILCMIEVMGHREGTVPEEIHSGNASQYPHNPRTEKKSLYECYHFKLGKNCTISKNILI